VEKLLLKIIQSLYQVSKEEGYAWSGNLIDIEGRVGLLTETGEIIEIDSVLPKGETGRFMLIWTQDDSEKLKREI